MADGEDLALEEWYAQQVAAYEQRATTTTTTTRPPSPSQLFVGHDTRSFCRLRPVLPFDGPASRCVSALGPSCVAHVCSTDARGRPACTQRPFRTDWALGPDASNDDVFELAVRPLADLAVAGATAAFVAFGQTGSGKTHTVSGVVDALARELYAARSPSQAVSCAYVQLLGDAVSDLRTGDAVQILEDRFGAINLKGATEIEPASAEDFAEAARAAWAARTTRETARNAASSRSHAVLRVTLRERDAAKLAAGAGGDGVLFVVDLAGSERASDRRDHTPELVAESRLINTSLMTLKDCIRARGSASSAAAAGRHVHVPYRASKLTLLLRDCFELAVRRPTKLAVVSCLSPVAGDVPHTLNTLRYASELLCARPPVVLARDDRDPASWSRERAREWVARASRGDADPDDVLPGAGDNGMTLASLPEAEFVARATASGRLSLVRAIKMHGELWRLVADARSHAKKKTAEAHRRAQAARDKDLAFTHEMLARLRSEDS
eukprot:m51a1_g8913 hypothetical protein (496) ;mRNA; f:783653-785198